MVTIIPYIQQIIIQFQFQKSDGEEQRRVLAEIVRPPKKEPPKQVTQRMQKVNAHVNSPGAGAGSMKFNFIPDLGIEGGGGEVAASTGDFTPVIFDEGKTDEDVIPVNNPIPQYPAKARDLGVQGDVEIIFIVNTEGKVESLNILKVPHPSFIPEIRKTVATWRFKPGKNQGIPVKVRIKQVISFTLNTEE
jgi:protein TonB